MERDTSLLSASTIGSPAAFSTAVKPPWTLSTHPSSDSSLLAHDILAQLPHDHSQINSADVTGRLSLDSVGSVHEKQDPISEGIGTGTATSLDDTSLGVLDLEAMQDSSMTKFLTSPRTLQELHLHVTSTGSTQAFVTASTEHSGASTLQGSAQAKGSVGFDERGRVEGRSILVEPPHPQVEDHKEDDGGDEGGGIPAELLERASTVCSSVGCSSSEWEEEEEEEEEEREDLATQQQSGLQSQGVQGEPPPAPPPEFGERREHSMSSGLPLTRLRGDGHENESVSHSIPTLQNGLEPLHPQARETMSLLPNHSEHHTPSAPPSRSLQNPHHHMPMNISASLHGSKPMEVVPNQQPEEPLREHIPAVRFEVDTILQGLEGGEEVVSHTPDSEEEDLVNMTLIGDEVEPTVMGEADEFSQFEPTHLASMLNRDSLLTIRPPVTAGQESSPKHPTPTTTTTTTAQAQVPLSTSVVATFPASVDRNGILHGDLKMSEQVRPVAEGFTDRDEHRGDKLVESSIQTSDSLAGKGKVTEMQPMASGGYFSTGQASEMSIGDPNIGRHDTGISLSSGGPATRSSRQLVVGEGGGEREEGDEYTGAWNEGGSPFEVVDATTTMEGLPSALLALTSFCDTGLDDTGMPGSSLSSHSSLASSLTELAGALGSKPTVAVEGAVTRSGAPEAESNARASQSGAVYNPFDSDDNASVGSFGQLEFEQSSDSFIAQLAKDEEEVQKANLFTHTLTPSFQTLSQDLTATSWSHLTNVGGEEGSIGSYFVKQSHTLGALPSTRLPPSDRPKFSDSDSHIILSPPEQLVPALPTSDGSSPTPQARDTSSDVDRTLVEEPEDTAISKPAQEKTIMTSSVSQTETQEGNLTPVITVHTPFPVQFEIPKLNLEDITASTPGSFNPPRVSEPAASHTQKPALHTSPSLQPDFNKESLSNCVTPSEPSTSSVVTSTAITTSKATPTITTSLDLESGPSPAGTEPRLSTGLEPRSTSRSWRPTGSSDTTLVFPELSALTFSPPPADVGSLDSMPTPSIAHLSAGFDITEATFHDTSFSTSLGLTKKEVSGTMVSQSPSELTRDKKPGAGIIIPGTQAATRMHKDASLTQMQEPPPAATSDPVLQPQSPTKSQSAASSSRKEKSSPKTVAARQKLAQLQATLEATRFDAENFLAKMKSTASPGSPLQLATSERSVGESPAISKSSDYLAYSTSPHKVAGSLQVGAGNTSLPVSYTLTVTSSNKASSLPSLHTSKEGLRYSFAMPCTPESHSFLQQPAVLPQEAQLTSVGTQVVEESSAEKGSPAGKHQLQDTHEETHQESPLPPTPSSGGDAKPPQVTSQPAITVTMPSTEHTPSLEQQQTSTSKSQGERKPFPQEAVCKDVPGKSMTVAVVSSESTRHAHVSSQKPPKHLTPPSTRGKGYSSTQKSQGHDVTKSSGVQTSLSDDILNRKVKSATKAPSVPLSTSDSVLEASWRRSKRKEEGHDFKPSVSSHQHSKLKASPKKTRTGAQVTTVTSTTTTSEIQLSPKHTLPSESPCTVTPPSLHTPSSPLHVGTSPPGKPIYTSPRSHPHTTHSPPKHGAKGRTKMPNAGSLHVPDSLCFNTVCCVGSFLSDQLLVANSGGRWLQLSFEICELYVEGAECMSKEHNTFSVPQRCYVSPHKSEAVKVVFTPHSAGSYEAVLQVQAQLVGVERDGNDTSLTSRVILKALAEKPRLEVSTGGHGPPGLDYGVLVGGSSVSLPLQLTNHGLAELPLRLSISATTLSQICFSFGEIPTPLLPSSPPSHLYSPPHTLSITLPPRPQKQAKPDPHVIDVHFRAPKKYMDNSSTPGSPDEISACVDITVDGASTVGTLCSLPVRAIVGVARLHVPRLLQAISLSCTAGQLVNREVPFKNAGNIPLRVRLRTSPDSAHFTIAPDFLLMEPSEEVQVSVCFSPPSAPLTSEGSLMIHVEPSGPNYEMKLRGTCTADERHRDGLLSCSKRSLYWGGVELNNSRPQKLVLHNSFQHKVPLQLSIRHQDSPFQLQNIDGATQSVHTQDIDILPQEQLPLYITYTPASEAVHCSALDICDTAHSKKYRIPLCGFGGNSQVEVVNARRSTNASWINLGEVVAGQCNAVKVSLYNSGQRAAFVQVLCYPGFGTIGDDSTPLPLDLASVTPSELILQPQHVKELLLVYHASEADEGQCLGFPSPLARLVLFTGEEILRQRLQRSFGGERSVQLTNSFNMLFLKHFSEQESVPSELDFSSFKVEEEEKFFEQQLRRVTISLSGSPQTENPLPQPLHPPPQSPPHTTHTLSPSYTPVTEGKATDLTRSPTSLILSSHTLTLPDTPVGHYSEKFLTICNPFSQPLRWHLNSVASPFVREISGGQSDICKATYSAFWVHERRGTILPHTSAEVLVTFQPHNQGSFSQIWDLQVSTDETGPKKIRISFGGKAMAVVPLHRRAAEHTPQSELVIQTLSSGSQPSSATMSQVYTASSVSQRKSVYIREDSIVFPLTTVGNKSTIKARVCNRDTLRHKFEVIKPTLPFVVGHHSFELGTRQCARLPIHFMPTTPGEYKGILAVKTIAGHQAFAVLRASSCP